ncbi:MAG: hypothetical protein II852_13045 [Bacteroidales bacterium]|jgi:hypothetical protein|nr:hypothetical protein [Bacteroidales bacterium]
MKKTTLFAIILLSTLVYGCLKNEELPPPSITISQKENEILNFSSINSADVKVHIESGEELRKFTTKTIPMSSWSDTIILFDRFTHVADIDLSFRIWKDFKLTSNKADSIFDVTYTAYTDEAEFSISRKLRYRYIYPQLDSFDIKVESAPDGKCLLDIENRAAYKYIEYTNHNFDLVYVNEMDGDFQFGTALISPNAPYLMRYFQRKYPSLLYDPAGKRVTECGIIADANLDWTKFNSAMLGENNNWNKFDRISALPPQDGVGVVDLQKNKLFKFRLNNGRYVMIRVLNRDKPQFTNASVITLRIYFQSGKAG